MAQIKIYARRSLLQQGQPLISQAIHAAVVSALQYPPDKKFHRFFPMDDSDFIHPADRSERYTIVEVSMFEGRSEGIWRASALQRVLPISGQPTTVTSQPRAGFRPLPH